MALRASLSAIRYPLSACLALLGCSGKDQRAVSGKR